MSNCWLDNSGNLSQPPKAISQAAGVPCSLINVSSHSMKHSFATPVKIIISEIIITSTPLNTPPVPSALILRMCLAFLGDPFRAYFITLVLHFVAQFYDPS